METWKQAVQASWEQHPAAVIVQQVAPGIVRRSWQSAAFAAAGVGVKLAMPVLSEADAAIPARIRASNGSKESSD